ncbi:hypothetical protein DFAR_2590003 [Desulfarculales bacterium]
MAKMESKGLLAKNTDKVLARLPLAGDLASAAGAELIIDSTSKKLELKCQIFAELESLAPAEAILASNTSSLSISSLVQTLRYPQRLLGLHFTPPVSLSRMVEVIRHETTSDEAFQLDVPAFVINRVFAVTLSQALVLVEEGVVRTQEVDMGMRLG